jgi:hypothetical protein
MLQQSNMSAQGAACLLKDENTALVGSRGNDGDDKPTVMVYTLENDDASDDDATVADFEWFLEQQITTGSFSSCFMYENTILIGNSGYSDTGIVFVYDNNSLQLNGPALFKNVYSEYIIASKGNFIADKGTLQLSNSRSGVLILDGGTATEDTNVVLGILDKLMITVETPGGTQGFLSYLINNIGLAGDASFTINSTSVSDASTVNWIVVSGNFTPNIIVI